MFEKKIVEFETWSFDLLADHKLECVAFFKIFLLSS
jgi:hypothetical protein